MVAHDSLRVLIVEDEALIAMQLEAFLQDEGHVVVGVAATSAEAKDMADATNADLALVDIHLIDGPTGVNVGEYVAKTLGVAVVFMTANAKRIPDDFVGAIGVVAKPYTTHGLSTALRFLVNAVRRPPPDLPGPTSLEIAPAFKERWRGS
jgi:two-component system, response regulator PdtaR